MKRRPDSHADIVTSTFVHDKKSILEKYTILFKAISGIRGLITLNTEKAVYLRKAET